jgi:hypothetical protein
MGIGSGGKPDTIIGEVDKAGESGVACTADEERAVVNKTLINRFKMDLKKVD